jgi:hypothetical protein
MLAGGEFKREFIRYGRISNLLGMVGLIRILRERNDDDNPLIHRSSAYIVRQWDLLLKGLGECRKTLLRKDATVLRYPVLRESFSSQVEQEQQLRGEEDDTPNVELASSSIFHEEYEDTIKVCMVRRTISTIKPYIDGNEALSKSMIVSTL